MTPVINPMEASTPEPGGDIRHAWERIGPARYLEAFLESRGRRNPFGPFTGCPDPASHAASCLRPDCEGVRVSWGISRFLDPKSHWPRRVRKDHNHADDGMAAAPQSVAVLRFCGGNSGGEL